MNADISQSNENVGALLCRTAAATPDGVAVVMPGRRDRNGRREYEHWTYRQLDDDSDRLAAGMQCMGIAPGHKLALLVRPSIDFISLVFAMFKAGAVIVLIDPGMGRGRMLECLDDVEPDGFVAIPPAQAVRALMRRRFAGARLNVTVGRRWFWGGRTVAQLRARGADDFACIPRASDDPAAIIFTSGSTGPAKGVLYTHGNFTAQVEQIRDRFGIAPGGFNLAAFPLFALFDAAMGTATIIPDMDAARPAQVDPANIVEAVLDWKATQAFASPAVWNAVGQYCRQQAIELPSLRCVFSAGAPVPPHVLQWMTNAMAPGGQMHTPYGATEALPVASISAETVLAETAPLSAQGAGTCVGGRFPGIAWKVIAITDEPIETIDQAETVPDGQIGELIVSGPQVTREYVTRRDANRLSKIADGKRVWHRMGDVGYLDQQDRFWFCGRKSQRLQTADGPMYTVPCEAIFNRHERVYRSALVGIGSAGAQRPVVVVEPWPEHAPQDESDRRRLIAELLDAAAENELTASIKHVLLHPSLPVDVRHNSKIFRERLAPWAAEQLGQTQ